MFLAEIMVYAALMWQLREMRPLVDGLTLAGAWWWGILAVHCVLLSAWLEASGFSAGWRSAGCYLAGTMLLTPSVVVLGARRPGAAAWHWFVVLPLVIVLQWPALTQLMNGVRRESIEIGMPAFSGVLLVLLMSTGNYFGTRQTFSSFLISVTVLLNVIPATGLVDVPFRSVIPLLSLILLWLTCVRVRRYLDQLNRSIRLSSTLHQRSAELWRLFRDLYGMVWFRRVMDRVNQFAVREKWSVRLTADGFQPLEATLPTCAITAGSAVLAARSEQPEDNNTERIVTTVSAALQPDPVPVSVPVSVSDIVVRRPVDVLCWVLRRFADDEWLRIHAGVEVCSGRIVGED